MLISVRSRSPMRGELWSDFQWRNSLKAFLISIPNTLRPKSGCRESNLLGFMEVGGSWRVGLPQAIIPICVPFSAVHRGPLSSWNNRRNTWDMYVVHTSSWKNQEKKKTKKPYGFDFPVSCYFISIENRNTNESKFMKMLDCSAWILNRIYSGLWLLQSQGQFSTM